MREGSSGMIHDVLVKPLKVLTDDRGFLMEMLRADDPFFEAFGQVYVTGCHGGVAKAWHYHKEQSDHFICVSGAALVVLYDSRQGSLTHGDAQEFVLTAPPTQDPAPLLLKIPPLVLHGFTAAGCEEARIITVPTRTYRYENPDEYRVPWDSKQIPYRWPSEVVRGG
jgi:dTDP-4-dehydrorhamnose 3,5-epimerase